MHILDLLILIIYFSVVLAIGFYFSKKNRNVSDYFVGSRKIGSWHIGLSVVATDVGGGFSIGLGGLGFAIGISGSWMLFTGLIGAWLSAVFLIPKVSRMENFKQLLTFPEIFKFFYGKQVAIVAGLISAIGYIGFTSSQILAGAKLASAAFIQLDLKVALVLMGTIVILYTYLGGLKAVIYTDTIQWIILISGLCLVGIPVAYHSIGGYQALMETLKPEFLSLSNIKFQTFINWVVTIVPIWFVGMTLYQRIYACKTEGEAKKAWFIAGLFEWPIMAFMGVLLGLFSRVAYMKGIFKQFGFGPETMIDPELGLPFLLKAVLPVGFLGLMLAAYFSAIMSTADSCLMAASGNVYSDLLSGIIRKNANYLRISRWITLGIGTLSLILAALMENVLELMLYSYAFMVSGLFIPLLGCFFSDYKSSRAAMAAMISGGSVTIFLTLTGFAKPTGFDPNLFGIFTALLLFVSITQYEKRRKYAKN